jgi:hypothetical protein
VIKKYIDTVIIVPGLGGTVDKYAPMVWIWNSLFHFETYIFSVDWYSRETFDEKMKRLVNIAAKLSSMHTKINLIGSSAGGSFVFNALCEHKYIFNKAINVGGRLCRGPQKGFRSFATRTASSLSFKESVITFEDKNEPKLTNIDRLRLMTVRPLFGDELVPWNTSVLKGATNIFSPTGEHSFSNIMSLTVLSHPLIQFFRK